MCVYVCVVCVCVSPRVDQALEPLRTENEGRRRDARIARINARKRKHASRAHSTQSVERDIRDVPSQRHQGIGRGV